MGLNPADFVGNSKSLDISAYHHGRERIRNHSAKIETWFNKTAKPDAPPGTAVTGKLLARSPLGVNTLANHIGQPRMSRCLRLAEPFESQFEHSKIRAGSTTSPQGTVALSNRLTETGPAAGAEAAL